MNKEILMGRLTRNPDVRYTPGDSGSGYAILYCSAKSEDYPGEIL